MQNDPDERNSQSLLGAAIKAYGQEGLCEFGSRDKTEPNPSEHHFLAID